MHRLPGGPRIAFRTPTVRRQVGPRREPRRDFLELLAQCLIARSAREDRAVESAVVVARTGSRAALLRRSESTRFSSASDDKVGGFPARSAASGSEQITEEERLRSLLLRAAARDCRRSQLFSRVDNLTLGQFSGSLERKCPMPQADAPRRTMRICCPGTACAARSMSSSTTTATTGYPPVTG
jgi:hypothetical protein